MTWELVVVTTSCLVACVTSLHLLLPYLRKRSNEETRLVALEAANVALTDRVARVEQVFDGGGVLGRLPRTGVSR